MCNGTASAVIGAIVGGAIGYFSALRVTRHHTFSQAAAKFRAAFAEQLYQLEEKKTDVFEILDARAYGEHQRARIEFEPYLSEGERRGLNESWQRYYHYRNFEGQEASPGSLDARAREIPKAIEILKEILIYAQNK